MDITTLTIEQARQGLADKQFSSAELTEAYLAAIEKVNPQVEAFLSIHTDQARDQARAADKQIQAGQAGPLTGIPLAIKDNITIQGTTATAGASTLSNYTATYDATVIQNLRECGAVFLGKTNLDEFAMGSSTENSTLATTKNPWDLGRVPGGSSGGSAAAVAARLCAGALGSDTGGSIRQPASFCGTVGLKPTYGRVSRHGLIAMSSSLDQIGPLTATVQDAAYILEAIAGQDSNDSTTVPHMPPGINADQDIKGMTIGVPREYFIEGMDHEVRQLVEQAINKLKELGAEIQEVSLPLTKYALAVYQVMMTAEVSSNLARYDGIRYGQREPADTLYEVYARSRAAGFGAETKRRIMLGTYALSSGHYDQYYQQTQKLRVLIRSEFADIFKKVDCLVTPTAPTVAFALGEKYEDPLTMYLSDIYTVPANIGDICALSLPCGFDERMPVGLQLMAQPFDEATLFRVGNAYERVTDWHRRVPPIIDIGS